MNKPVDWNVKSHFKDISFESELFSEVLGLFKLLFSYLSGMSHEKLNRNDFFAEEKIFFFEGNKWATVNSENLPLSRLDFEPPT